MTPPIPPFDFAEGIGPGPIAPGTSEARRDGGEGAPVLVFALYYQTMETRMIDHEDVARRAKILYEQGIRSQVETQENIGKIVVIDPETGAFAMDAKGIEASRHLHALHPDAPLYGIRIGYDSAISLGGVIERTFKP